MPSCNHFHKECALAYNTNVQEHITVSIVNIETYAVTLRLDESIFMIVIPHVQIVFLKHPGKKRFFILVNQ